jgi:hypothetical protein
MDALGDGLAERREPREGLEGCGWPEGTASSPNRKPVGFAIGAGARMRVVPQSPVSGVAGNAPKFSKKLH